jgi:hypothetical protein
MFVCPSALSVQDRLNSERVSIVENSAASVRDVTKYY